MSSKPESAGHNGDSVEEHIQMARNACSNTEEEAMFRTVDVSIGREWPVSDVRHELLMEVAEVSATSVVEALKR